MQTIQELERTLKAFKTQQSELNTIKPHISTGICIDLKSPDGNVFCIIGLYNRLAKQYNIAPLKSNDYTRLTYKQILALCKKQFGFTFING